MAKETGKKPELKWVKLTELYIPSDYQRPSKSSTSLGSINYIKANFNWASCGALIVCQLAESKPPQYAIIDESIVSSPPRRMARWQSFPASS
jgi:hypothetical protein